MASQLDGVGSVGCEVAGPAMLAGFDSCDLGVEPVHAVAEPAAAVLVAWINSTSGRRRSRSGRFRHSRRATSTSAWRRSLSVSRRAWRRASRSRLRSGGAWPRTVRMRSRSVNSSVVVHAWSGMVAMASRARCLVWRRCRPCSRVSIGSGRVEGSGVGESRRRRRGCTTAGCRRGWTVGLGRGLRRRARGRAGRRRGSSCDRRSCRGPC